jgi:hypothetical protein
MHEVEDNIKVNLVEICPRGLAEDRAHLADCHKHGSGVSGVENASSFLFLELPKRHD